MGTRRHPVERHSSD